jgi:uncharacterized protein YkwD
MVRRYLAVLGGAVAACALLWSVPAGAFGAGCADEDLVPTSADAPRVEIAVLCTINRERARARLTPLRRAPKLDLSARFHTVSMIRRHFLAHEAPGHPSLLARIRGFGYFAGARDGIYSENIGAGPSTNGTAHALIEAWMASPGHRENLMLPAFRDIGISAVPAPPDRAFFADFPSTVYTTDFGTRYLRRRCARGPAGARSPRATPQQRWCRRGG